MRFLLIIAGCLVLAGCGITAKIDARNEYQASAENYKACLAANAATPKNCEGLRFAMETDERKYNVLSAGIDPGAQQNATVTVINR